MPGFVPVGVLPRGSLPAPSGGSTLAAAASLTGSAALSADARMRAMLATALSVSASVNATARGRSYVTSSMSAVAIIKAYAGTASRLNGGLQNCIVSWLVTETGVKAVLFNQNAPRPALPYASILVEQVAPHQHAGRSAPSDQGTVDVSTMQEVAMQVQFFGPGSLLSAEIALDSLGKPSIQAVFEACGIAMLGTSAITNEARLVADRYEEGAGFTAKLRITDVMHDNSGLLSTVSLEGEVGGHSAAYTIN